MSMQNLYANVHSSIFIIAHNLKQSKCPPTGEWINKTWFSLTVECYSAIKSNWEGFPGGAVVKNPPANAVDTGSSPGPGRSHMLRSN